MKCTRSLPIRGRWSRYVQILFGEAKDISNAHSWQSLVVTSAKPPDILPCLPVEVIGVIGEHLAKLQYLGTLANLNVACKAVRWETKPILWRVFRASDVYSVTDHEPFTTEDYEQKFIEKFADLDGYKHIQ